MGRGGEYKVIEKFYNGAYVKGCSVQGNWVKIIFECAESGSGTEDYSIPCKVGWAYKKYLSSIDGWEMEDTHHAKKYSELPVKEDLSYFLTPKNIFAQAISIQYQSSLNYYEATLKARGEKRNIKKEMLLALEAIGNKKNREEIFRAYFAIDKDYFHYFKITTKINSSGFSEFEIDDFEERLQKELASEIKQIEHIEKAYKKVPKHIRLINLNIPVKYSKKSKEVASIKIKKMIFLQKLNYSKSILKTNFMKELLNNKYISKYTVPSKEKINLTTNIQWPKGAYGDGPCIEANPKILNNLGKINKGNDMITELTIRVANQEIQPSFSNKHIITILNQFEITSFKLKSSDKRFILNYYVDRINAISIMIYKPNFIIKENDFSIIKRGDF
jgi:hypothetical protein